MKNDPLSLVVAALCSLVAGTLLSLVLLALVGCHHRPTAPAALVPAGGLVIPEPAGAALDLEALPESSPVAPLVPVPQVPAASVVSPSVPPAAAPLSPLVEVPALQASNVAPSVPSPVLPWWRSELGRLALCAAVGAAAASTLTFRIFGPRALPSDEKSGSHRSQGPWA